MHCSLGGWIAIVGFIQALAISGLEAYYRPLVKSTFVRPHYTVLVAIGLAITEQEGLSYSVICCWDGIISPLATLE